MFSTRARVVIGGSLAALVLIVLLRALGYAETPAASPVGGEAGTAKAWAVGERGTILHFDGTTWVSVASGVTGGLSSVSGTGPKDVWAVGAAGVVHFDGKAWTKNETNHGYGTLNVVWARARNDVWVGGNEGITLRWDGRSWTRHPLAGGARMNVYALQGTSKDDVWGLAAGGAWVIRWNGEQWTDGRFFIGRTRGALWVTAPDDAWLVFGGVVYRWRGKEWESEGNRDYIWATSLLGYAPDELWAAGGKAIWRRAKGVWEKMALPELDFYARLHSLAKAHDGRAWAVGAEGLILQYADGVWRRDTAPTSAYLASVWAY